MTKPTTENPIPIVLDKKISTPQEVWNLYYHIGFHKAVYGDDTRLEKVPMNGIMALIKEPFTTS